MSDFSAECTVVHQEDVEVADAADCELFKTVREVVSGFNIRAITDFGHLLVASETTTHSVINACIYK